MRLNARGDGLLVAGDLDRRIEVQHIAILGVIPEREKVLVIWASSVLPAPEPVDVDLKSVASELEAGPIPPTPPGSSATSAVRVKSGRLLQKAWQ